MEGEGEEVKCGKDCETSLAQHSVRFFNLLHNPESGGVTFEKLVWDRGGRMGRVEKVFAKLPVYVVFLRSLIFNHSCWLLSVALFFSMFKDLRKRMISTRFCYRSYRFPLFSCQDLPLILRKHYFYLVVVICFFFDKRGNEIQCFAKSSREIVAALT